MQEVCYAYNLKRGRKEGGRREEGKVHDKGRKQVADAVSAGGLGWNIVIGSIL